jgi:hypothetical protein
MISPSCRRVRSDRREDRETEELKEATEYKDLEARVDALRSVHNTLLKCITGFKV